MEKLFCWLPNQECASGPAPSYRGGPILSLSARVEAGQMTMAEIAAATDLSEEEAAIWLTEGDGRLIPLTSSREEAEELLAETGGLVVEVDAAALREQGLLTQDSLGYPAARDQVPPEAIIGVEEVAAQPFTSEIQTRYYAGRPVQYRIKTIYVRGLGYRRTAYYWDPATPKFRRIMPLEAFLAATKKS